MFMEAKIKVNPHKNSTIDFLNDVYKLGEKWNAIIYFEGTMEWE